jgi:alkanesulfonate monooxygenase SsuD/methylene tetrahydromethanopterin reductase-like flavin-dependent oxidoreductase (luciferase family)
MSLMCAGPVDQRTYDIYVETWHKHKGDTVRFDAPSAQPRVGCTMLVAIAPDEREAIDIARRGMDGLTRRAHAAHRFDRLIMSEEECDTVLAPLRGILAHHEEAINAGAGTPEQIAERFAAILEPGLIDYIVLQLPVGDMTFDEAKRTLELFVSDVKPQLEQSSLAA